MLAVSRQGGFPRGRFERAMRQRNRLFQLREGSPSHFAGLEEQMAEAGVAIFPNLGGQLDFPIQIFLHVLGHEAAARVFPEPMIDTRVVGRIAGDGFRRSRNRRNAWSVLV